MSTLSRSSNPVEPFLRMDRMPHIWCPGCGIGTTVNCFTRALVESKADSTKSPWSPASAARAASPVTPTSIRSTPRTAAPFRSPPGLKLSNPDLQVVVYSRRWRPVRIGGNHFIHAARRNMDLKVICVNNLIYAMTGGQTAPTTPLRATAPHRPTAL